MKSLFFVAFAAGLFPGMAKSVMAQANLNTAAFANEASKRFSQKFIEGIEVRQERILPGSPVYPEMFNTTMVPALKAAGMVSHLNIEKCSALQFKYAMLMERNVESVNNLALYNFIEDWWGTRYRYGGTGRKGIDCSSFTGKLMTTVYGYSLPRTARAQFNICDKLAREELAEGDLVFFNTRRGVSHVGIYLGDNYFVHSSLHDGVSINSLADPYYSKRYIGGGRVNTCN